MINLFKRKKKAKKDIFEKGNFNLNDVNIYDKHEYMVSLAYSSPMAYTIYPACAACYGIPEEKNSTVDEKIDYIGRRVKSHHTSILEHSNIVLQVFINLKINESCLYEYTKCNKNINDDLIDFDYTNQDIITLTSEIRDVCRYLTIHTDTINEDGNSILRITIGGSIRGYRYIFENIKNRHNKIFISMFEVLKRVVPKQFFIDFIKDGMMEDYYTIDIDKSMIDHIPQRELNNIKSDMIDIINMDNLQQISDLTGLSKEDCLDFVSITVDFKNMSRVITQQVTRHRNGITQESQRYVNYSESLFNSPEKFKDKYDKTKTYDTPIGSYSMNELGHTLTSIYRYLVEQGVDKEDARGFLPQNVQCGKLFMTFNLRTLFVFLNLRLDSHAQAEVRIYAEKLAELTEIYARDLGINDMYLASSVYSAPAYLRDQNNDLYNNIDEEV